MAVLAPRAPHLPLIPYFISLAPKTGPNRCPVGAQGREWVWVQLRAVEALRGRVAWPAQANFRNVHLSNLVGTLSTQVALAPVPFL